MAIMRIYLEIAVLWTYLFLRLQAKDLQIENYIQPRGVQSPATCGYTAFYDQLVRRNVYSFRLRLPGDERSATDRRSKQLTSISKNLEQRCNQEWSSIGSQKFVRSIFAEAKEGEYRINIDVIAKLETDQSFPVFDGYDCILNPVPEVDWLTQDGSSWPSSCSLVEKTDSSRMYHSYTSEENELLIKQRELGKSWRDIGKLFPRRHWATLMHQYYRLIKNYPPTVDGSRVYNYWTPGEDERLVEAKELGFTWKEIAELFDNERSQESLYGRYQLFKGPSKTQNAVKRIPYSPEDDKRLLEAVEADFTWREIAELFDGQRAVHSLKTRFKTLKADNKSISGIRHPGGKHSLYTTEEDARLVKARGIGLTWNQVADLFEGRRDIKSLKARYYKLSEQPDSPAEKSSPRYTPDEDDILIEARASRLTWEETVALFGGRRNEDALKARYYKLSKMPMSRVSKANRNYTADEDELIVREREWGTSYPKIAELLPDRSTKSVENRYYKLMKEREKSKNEGVSEEG